MSKYIISLSLFLLEVLLLLPMAAGSLLSRFVKKKIDVGLGPEPLINNVYHKKVLLRKGYTAETYVNTVYYIVEDFDFRADLLFPGILGYGKDYFLFFYSLFRFRCLYFYFNGGPLGFSKFLWRLEPYLFKLSGVRTVVMPYGSDVQDMSRSPNLAFKDAVRKDYRGHRHRRRGIEKRIDLWTRHADHVMGGCEWVDYMFHWDTLMLAHFSIDTQSWQAEPAESTNTKTLKVLHAPNHRAIKGTRYFVDAVEELKEEGYDVDLVLLEGVSNDVIKKAMEQADIVADQLIIGWYAMFALEAMSLEKPVLCFLREDLINLYILAGLIKENEIPIVQCTPFTVKEKLRELAQHREMLQSIGRKSREFVLKHHSLDAVGEIFHEINVQIGLLPSKEVS